VVRAQVEQTPVPTGTGDPPVRVTVSMGVCTVGGPDQLADPDELVRRADEALYRAKRAGRNRVETACGPSAEEGGPAHARSTDQARTLDSVNAV
jgi:diguanylate cyclase (GGDEF)-like protein